MEEYLEPGKLSENKGGCIWGLHFVALRQKKLQKTVAWGFQEYNSVAAASPG